MFKFIFVNLVEFFTRLSHDNDSNLSSLSFDGFPIIFQYMVLPNNQSYDKI